MVQLPRLDSTPFTQNVTPRNPQTPHREPHALSPQPSALNLQLVRLGPLYAVPEDDTLISIALNF